MSGGRAERDEVLRRQLKAITPEQFEQLVYELARQEDTRVQRFVHPDGGADVVRPETASEPAKVWQAKRYPGTITWGECEGSLDASIERWKPGEVVFVFPRDFSEQAEQAFRTRLGERHRDNEVEVVNPPWTLSELVRRLNEDDALRVRFFGKEQEDLQDAMTRAVSAGGRLTSPQDFVARAQTLSEWAERQDERFRYGLYTGPVDIPAPNWDELPYLSMDVAGERVRVQVPIWPREGAVVEPPTYAFYDSAEGERARLEAVRALAAGEPAVVTDGAQVRIDRPKLIEQLGHDIDAVAGGTLTLQPGDPVTIELLLEGETGAIELTVHVRPVPAPPGAAVAFAGFTDENALFQLVVTLLEEPQVQLTTTASGSFGTNAAAGAATAEILLAFTTHEQLTIRSDELLPASGAVSGRFRGDHSEELVQELRWRAEFYSDVAFIEQRVGISLPVPERFEPQDLAAIATVAEVLRTGEGTGSVSQASGMVEDPLEIPRLPDDFAKQKTMRRMVSYSIFGQEVELGLADYEIPRLKVIDIIPHGHLPTSPARVVLGPEDADEAPFRLVGWTPPADE